MDKFISEWLETRSTSEFRENSYLQARKVFYQKDGKVLEAIARDYDIHYLVMNNSHADKYGALPPWSVAYKNKYYTILTSPHYKNTLPN